MAKFTDSHADLSADFARRDIPTGAPGFCDHPNFVAAERADPNFLRNYAAFVATHPFDEEYLRRARVIVPRAAGLMREALVRNGRVGACVDVSGILARILERERIWCCPIKGSLTVAYPTQSGLEPSYFWSVDHGEFVAGHAWVLAPPFSIVDVTVQQQPYLPEKRAFLPEQVVLERGEVIQPSVGDIVSPSARADMRRHGVPDAAHLRFGAPDIDDIVRVFPAQQTAGPAGATLRYFPVAIGMPDQPLEGLQNMRFDGLLPIELYERVFRGNLFEAK